MPVLVLDGHCRAALETLQSLGRRGLRVDLAAESPGCLGMHSRYCRHKLLQPSQKNAEEFERWLRALDAQNQYALIVPSTEASLMGLRRLPGDDPLRRKSVLPGNSALDVAVNKQKTWDLAAELNVPAPRSVLISSLPEATPVQTFPLVLKPVRSKVMIGGELQTLAVAIVTNEAQRLEQLRRWLPLTPVLQQEYVVGRGVGVEFLYEHGRKIWHFAHERVHEFPLTGGASAYRRSIAPPQGLLRDAETLLNALQWHGVAMVEFKLDGQGQHWLMEINPRLWGSLALPIDAGVDFPWGLLQVARGETPQPQPEYRTLHYTRDLRTDLEWFKANLAADRRDPLLMTRPRLASLLELLRPLTRRESWDHFDWRDPGITCRIVAQAVTDQLRPLIRKVKIWKLTLTARARHRAVQRKISNSGQVRKVVFVCLGNICRSPLAAGLAATRLPGIEVHSAGLYPKAGRSSPEKILRLSRLLGVDLSAHRSIALTREQLSDADLVLVMDRENLSAVRRQFPECAAKTTLLGLFANPPLLEIADPYALNETEAGRICEQLREAVDGLAASFRTASAGKQPVAHPANSAGFPS